MNILLARHVRITQGLRVGARVTALFFVLSGVCSLGNLATVSAQNPSPDPAAAPTGQKSAAPEATHAPGAAASHYLIGRTMFWTLTYTTFRSSPTPTPLDQPAR